MACSTMPLPLAGAFVAGQIGAGRGPHVELQFPSARPVDFAAPQIERADFRQPRMER